MKKIINHVCFQKTFIILLITTVAIGILGRLVFKVYTPHLMNSTKGFKSLHYLLKTFSVSSPLETSQDVFNANVTQTSLSQKNVTSPSQKNVTSPSQKNVTSLSPKNLTSPSKTALTLPGISTLHVRYESDFYTAALQKMGYERAEDNEFKSKFIITPMVYENDTVIKPPGVRKTKIISLHRPFPNDRLSVAADYNPDCKKCPYSECEIDIKGQKTNKADMVIFLCKGLRNPPRRPPGQLWALGCLESAVHWGYPDYNIWRDAFNITMSHRFDADIVVPYVKLAWRHRSMLLSQDVYVAMAKQKTKMAVWWVSNCRKDRLNFVKELQKHISVDIYGGCGNFDCPRSIDSFCRQMLNTTYKFYLGFENSFCKDYVTEKLAKTFQQRVHIVPVLKGGVDYEKHFPPGAIVDGNKFKNAKELGLYLKQLGNDLPRYSKMLQEADKLAALPVEQFVDWCAICEQLHTRKFGLYKDIKIWSHNNTCWDNQYSPT